MPNHAGGWRKRLLYFSGLALGLTGLGQMPIFSRYYVASVPGLGWLGDFYITSKLHLVFAVAFCFLLGLYLVDYLGGRYAWRDSGGLLKAVAALCALTAGTGILRLMQNGKFALFTPQYVRFLDWSHLGFAFALGVCVLWMALVRRRSGADRGFGRALRA